MHYEERFKYEFTVNQYNIAHQLLQNLMTVPGLIISLIQCRP